MVEQGINMGILDFFKKKKVEPKHQAEGLGTPKPKKKSEKELATERGEPWVGILSMEIDTDNLHQGSFELDWNDKFVANLVRAGYQLKPTDSDADIVDRWFQNVCRNVVLETWEQEQAINPDYTRPIQSKDIGNGRSEVS
jgi:hypothetical protein